MAEIRLEVPAENSVYEVLYDGVELPKQPPTMSEKLTELARKIDFGVNDGEPGEDEEEKKEEEEEKPLFEQPHWPFENIRDKIRNAHTEMCVLHDVLAMVKEKRYMCLDPVHTDQPDSKQYIQFLALKKSLSSAGNILLSGAERLRSSHLVTTNTGPGGIGSQQRPGQPTEDFHTELLRLRENWRLKKVGNTIIGDLSYRSAGSHFKHTGIFEVTKSEEDKSGPSNSLMPGGVSPIINRGIPQSSLKVTVPAELEGSAYIFVCIKKDEEDICSAQLSNNDYTAEDPRWQLRLERAQNVLFCKELFRQLAREAVKLTPSIPHLVVGNQITATIFPGIHLLIGLCYSDAKGKTAKSGGSGPGGTSTRTGSGASMMGSSSSSGVVVPGKYSHENDLEHSLHQLLHRVYHHTFQHPLPHPVYAQMGLPKKRRIAGPEGMDRNQLLQTVKEPSLLEQIICQVQHNFLRLRTMYVIDQLAMELKDPLIVSHWNAFNSLTQSCVKITIVTQGYDSVVRTKLVIHIYERTLKCVCRDGKVMTMSFEPQELRNLILCQISQHNMAAVQCLAKYTGWTVLSSEQNIGIGSIEPLGNASTVMLASPMGNKIIGVRSVPSPGVTVYVSCAPRKDFYPSTVVSEQRWENLAGDWREVRLERMEGRNFLSKIELLMAVLTA